MAEHLNEAVAQSLVAALVAEALVRLWGVDSPHQRLAWRVATLIGPLVLLVAFELLAPARHGDGFGFGPALFSTRHLRALTLWGTGVDRLWPWPVWGLGALLLGRDLLTLLSERARPQPPELGPAPEVVTSVVARLCEARNMAPPRVVEVRSTEPLLLCVGVREPRLLVSRALIELLDEGELEAALAHELSHVSRRDVRWGWLLLGARVLQAFNPVAQVLGRMSAHELERRADADAAQWTGRPAALASAVLKVYGEGPAVGWGEQTLGDRLEQARAWAVEDRCRNLLARPRQPAWAPPGPALSTMAALAIGALLFFVT